MKKMKIRIIKATMQNQPIKPILQSNPVLGLLKHMTKPLMYQENHLEEIFPPPCKDWPVAKPSIQQRNKDQFKIAYDLQEHLWSQNKAVATLKCEFIIIEAKRQMMYNGYPITAIIDTGSQLNVMRWNNSI